MIEVSEIHVIPIRQPKIDDHVLFAYHDMPCPVCWSKHANLHMNTGIFHPCVDCSEKGWKTEFKKESLIGRVIRRIQQEGTK